jgi:hypothetical protein
MRGHAHTHDETMPVLLGRWLFTHGYLTLHSPDRTDAGDRWAHAVGGEIPSRDHDGSDENAVLSGQGALDLLNKQDWRSPRWPELS